MDMEVEYEEEVGTSEYENPVVVPEASRGRGRVPRFTRGSRVLKKTFNDSMGSRIYSRNSWDSELWPEKQRVTSYTTRSRRSSRRRRGRAMRVIRTSRVEPSAAVTLDRYKSLAPGSVLYPGVVVHSDSAHSYEEIERLLLFTEVHPPDLVCTKVPYAFLGGSGSFMVDLTVLEYPDDLLEDGLGRWGEGSERSRYYLEEEGVIRRIDVHHHQPETYSFKLKKQRYVHPVSNRCFIKSVFRLYDEEDNLFKMGVVTYLWTCEPFNVVEKQKKCVDGTPIWYRPAKALTDGSLIPYVSPPPSRRPRGRRPGRGQRGAGRGRSSATATALICTEPAIPSGQQCMRLLCEYHARRCLAEEAERRGLSQDEVHDFLIDIFGVLGSSQGLLQIPTEELFWVAVKDLKEKWIQVEQKYRENGEEDWVSLLDFFLSEDARNYLTLNLEKELGEEGGLSISWEETDLGFGEEELRNCWLKAGNLLRMELAGEEEVEDVDAGRSFQIRKDNQDPHLFVCEETCQDFSERFQNCFCPHTLAAADIVGKLAEFLAGIRKKMSQNVQ